MSASFGSAARIVAATLGRAGYTEEHWFPIGANYEHGFVVTTRLERIDPDGTPRSPGERWVSSYPQAATLLWLVGSLEPYLPTPGRYRVLLIAFTDLHSPVPGRPQRLDEETAMGGPGFRASAFPVQRPVRAGYRAGVYVYEYEASSGEGRGRFISADPKIPAKGHVERAGLLALSSAQPCDRDE